VLIKNRSMLTNKIHEMEIDVTHEQIAEWENGALIQNVMPHLTSDEREFIMTGITPTEWDETFDIDESME